MSELTSQVKRLLEGQVGTIWVTGEVTNLRAQSSGHRYFTLKDAGSQLSCVLFRAEPVAHRELLEDGQKVLLQGDVTVYEARGQYQLIVRAVELQGVGALQIAFEKLKQKLAAEGLFAPERKRELPRYPQRIGLVTSPTGAAIRDVLHVVQRRNPGLEIIFAPCSVQGDCAGKEIAAAIRLLNEFTVASVCDCRDQLREDDRRSQTAATRGLDLILVTRGGAHVGHKIADREINLMPDRGNDRHYRLEDRPRYNFFVERPQVLEAAAATSDQDQVQSPCSGGL